MEPITIYFQKEVTATKKTIDDPLTKFINEEVEQAAQYKSNSSYIDVAKSQIKRNDIENYLIKAANSKIGIIYNRAENTNLEMNLDQTYHAQSPMHELHYNWNVKSFLISINYIVISFFSDKKIVCYKENDNELLFIDTPAGVKVYITK